MPRITITAPERPPQPYQLPLDSQIITLGRSEENDVVIDCASVSSKHAQMVRVQGGFELRDLASTNGTKFDGERRMVIPLHKGVVLELGDVLFEYDLKSEEEAELAGETFADGEEDSAKVSPTAESVSSGRSGVMMAILFLVLAALAFAVGMELSHRKNTGQSLWGTLGAPSAPAGVPASVTPPAVKEGSN